MHGRFANRTIATKVNFTVVDEFQTSKSVVWGSYRLDRVEGNDTVVFNRVQDPEKSDGQRNQAVVTGDVKSTTLTDLKSTSENTESVVDNGPVSVFRDDNITN